MHVCASHTDHAEGRVARGMYHDGISVAVKEARRMKEEKKNAQEPALMSRWNHGLLNSGRLPHHAPRSSVDQNFPRAKKSRSTYLVVHSIIFSHFARPTGGGTWVEPSEWRRQATMEGGVCGVMECAFVSSFDLSSLAACFSEKRPYFPFFRLFIPIIQSPSIRTSPIYSWDARGFAILGDHQRSSGTESRHTHY